MIHTPVIVQYPFSKRFKKSYFDLIRKKRLLNTRFCNDFTEKYSEPDLIEESNISARNSYGDVGDFFDGDNFKMFVAFSCCSKLNMLVTFSIQLVIKSIK